MEIKKIGTLPLTDATAENTNVLIEEGGAAKRIPAEKLVPKIELPEDLLHYSEQELTEEQKAQARKNIGAISEDEVPDGLPDGALAYQQLVTDANGVVKWEDRTHYVTDINRYIAVFDENELKSNEEKILTNGERVVYKSIGTFLKPYSGSVNDYYWHDIGSDSYIKPTYNYFFQTSDMGGAQADILGNPYLFREWDGNGFSWEYSGDEEYAVVIDWNSDRSTATIYSKSSISEGAYFGFVMQDGYVTAELDEKFIPSTVPVIQSAQVGQTVVVKAVDENGKPTEWETVEADGLPEGATANQVLVTDGDGVAKWEERTHYDHVNSIEWNGVISEDAIYVGSGQSKAVRVSELHPSAQELINNGAEFSVLFDGQMSTMSVQGDAMMQSGDVEPIGGFIIIVHTDNAVSGDFTFPFAGIYFLYTSYNDSPLYTSKLRWHDAKKISKFCVPSGIDCFIVNFITDDDGNLTADRTVGEIETAVSQGKFIVGRAIRWQAGNGITGSDVYTLLNLDHTTVSESVHYAIFYAYSTHAHDRNTTLYSKVTLADDGTVSVENGKHRFAVDELRLVASNDSSKVFAINVDADGTLSATAVTE